MTHRFVALLITAGVLSLWFLFHRLRAAAPQNLIALSRWWVFFLVVQITLGAWTIWSNKAADIATAHVAVGATMLALGVSLVALTARSRTGRSTAPAAESSLISQEVHA